MPAPKRPALATKLRMSTVCQVSLQSGVGDRRKRALRLGHPGAEHEKEHRRRKSEAQARAKRRCDADERVAIAGSASSGKAT